MGALSGGLAGFLFGVSAFLVQTAITRELIASYGDSAVDHGAALLNPTLVIPMGLLGAFAGILYVLTSRFVPWLARAGGLPFAALLTLALQPLLAAGLDFFSAVVTVAVRGPGGSIKTGAIEDVAPPLLLGLLMSALLFLEGLAVHRFAQLGTRWMPRLPAAAYAVIAAGLGLPGLTFLGLLVLLATGRLGGE